MVDLLLTMNQVDLFESGWSPPEKENKVPSSLRAELGHESDSVRGTL